MTAIQRAIRHLDDVCGVLHDSGKETSSTREIVAELRLVQSVDGDLAQIQQALIDWVKRNTSTCARCGVSILPLATHLMLDGGDGTAKEQWRVYTGKLAWSPSWSQFGRDGSSNKRRYCGDCSKRVEQVLDLAESEVDREA